MDAGSPGEADRILSAIRNKGVEPHTLALILLTHGHVDHSAGAAALRELTGAPVRALDTVENMPDLRAILFRHASRFRAGLASAGFKLLPGEHPIIPVMIGDAALAGRFADRLLAEGVYVIGFSSVTGS